MGASQALSSAQRPGGCLKLVLWAVSVSAAWGLTAGGRADAESLNSCQGRQRWTSERGVEDIRVQHKAGPIGPAFYNENVSKSYVGALPTAG
jgi:hypothetical protein